MAYGRRSPQDESHVRHYPLDVPMSFDRYEHRRLTARDIMVHRLMADYMRPSRKRSSARDLDVESEAAGDLVVANQLLLTSSTDKPSFWEDIDSHVLSTAARHYLETDSLAFRTWLTRAAPPRKPDGPAPNPNTGSVTRVDRKSRRRLFDLKLERQGFWSGKTWRDSHTKHVQSVRPQLAMQDGLPLYDGGTVLPSLRKTMDRFNCSVHGSRMAMRDTHWTISTRLPGRCHFPVFPEKDGTMRWMQPISQQQKTWVLDMTANSGRGRQPNRTWHTGWKARPERFPGGPDHLSGFYYPFRQSRSSSEPPPGAVTVAKLPALPHLDFFVAFPTMSAAYLDKRSRRRSLSRSRVQEMFDWDGDVTTHPWRLGKVPGPRPHPGRTYACENCKEPGHNWTDCDAPCGHCGAPSPASFNDYIAPVCDFTKEQDLLVDLNNYPYLPGYHQNPHYAPDCPVPRENRCKCIRFPTFHTAKRCSIPCRRPCGSPHRPGTFKHKNAMTCKSRCCMCGAHGHAGKDCRLKVCRCGESHLGQDCSWNVVCPAKGCDRYLCGMHCRHCGSTEAPFIKELERKCWKCLGVPEPPPPPPSKEDRKHLGKLTRMIQQQRKHKPWAEVEVPGFSFAMAVGGGTAVPFLDAGNAPAAAVAVASNTPTWKSIFGDGRAGANSINLGGDWLRRRSF